MHLTSPSPIFSWVSVLLMTPHSFISEPVPEEVAMVTMGSGSLGAICPFPVPPKTKSQRSCSGFAAMRETATDESSTAPPPSATMKSQPSSCASLPAASQSSFPGFSTTDGLWRNSAPAFRSSSTVLSKEPFL